MMKEFGLISLIIFCFMVLAPAVPAKAGGNEQPKIHGKTYGEWSAEWWKWVRSIPDPDGMSNPLTSSGEVDCTIGQAGPVFFLAGTLGGPAERSCTVPKGKKLFFPILNLIFINEPPEDSTEDEKREILDGIFSDTFRGVLNSRACRLDSTVNGRPVLFSAVATARTQSPAFRLEIGPDDVFGLAEGIIDKEVVSDGYWVMLRLSQGEHTLRFQGALCDFDTGEPLTFFAPVDVIYHLTVEEVDHDIKYDDFRERLRDKYFEEKYWDF